MTASASRTRPAAGAAETLAALPVQAHGHLLRLADIATVRRTTVDPPTSTMQFNGKPAMGIGITMADGGNMLDLGRQISAKLATIEPTLPLGVHLTAISDQSAVVAVDVGDFQESFLEALAIVLLVSFVSLGWRTGIVVAISVPLVLAGVFIGMKLMGIDLQRISLGAMVIALGLLVGRRDHRGRDHGGEAGTRLGPRARRQFRLHFHRVPNADPARW